MEHLIDFDPKTAEPFSQVVLPPELGLEHIVRAVRPLGLPQSNALRRAFSSGVPNSGLWYQVNYPGPVMHLVPFNGGYIVEIYANGNGRSHQAAFDLTMSLSTTPSNSGAHQ